MKMKKKKESTPAAVLPEFLQEVKTYIADQRKALELGVKGHPDRAYMNKRWCVRCHKDDATPWLRECYDRNLKVYAQPTWRRTCIDLGCGNGRNTRWMRAHGFEVIPIDHAAGCPGYRDVVLGESPLPVFSRTVGVVLANYVFMFLTPTQQGKVLEEIDRVAMDGAWLVLEYYPAKDSWCPTAESAAEMQKEHIEWLENHTWQVHKDLKQRALLKRIG